MRSLCRGVAAARRRSLSRIVTAKAGEWERVAFEELAHTSRRSIDGVRATEPEPIQSGYESIRAAEQEAETIVRSAREAAQQIVREAEREGYAKGRQEAMEEMRRRLEPLELGLQEACRQVAAARHAVIANTEEELVGLAVAIAERVLRSELGARRDAAAQFVRSALEVAGSRKVITVRINPGDYELLMEHRAELLGSQESTRLIPDPAIASWGCVVEVETGLVDARVESQLQEAARLLGRDEI